MDAPILLRRIGENSCFILWRGEPGGRTCAVKIEHDLGCARLAGKQINPANLVEMQTRWHRPRLHRRLFYLGTTCEQRGHRD